MRRCLFTVLSLFTLCVFDSSVSWATTYEGNLTETKQTGESCQRFTDSPISVVVQSRMGTVIFQVPELMLSIQLRRTQTGSTRGSSSYSRQISTAMGESETFVLTDSGDFMGRKATTTLKYKHISDMNTICSQTFVGKLIRKTRDR